MRIGKYLSIGAAFLMLILIVVAAGCSRDDESSRKKGPLKAETFLGNVAVMGKPAPDFELQDTSGKLWKLSDLKGQVVFVNFWATWCPPCREEMPSMQKLYEIMPKDGFKMLTILSNDDPALAGNFAAQNGFNFPILIDPDSEAAKSYGITGVPETYIVDKKGILRQKYLGPRKWDSDVAKHMLQVYINS